MGEIHSSAVLSGAADLIGELGGDAMALARLARLPSAALFRPDLNVLGYSITDFFELAAAQCHDRSFGMRLAQREKDDPLGPLGDFLNSARTVDEMLTDLVEHFAVFSEAAVVAYDRVDGGMITTFEGRAGHCESEVQMVEFALARTVLSVRRVCDPTWRPPAVTFRHSEAGETTLHNEIFGANVMFDQERNGIYYDEQILVLPWFGATNTSRDKARDTLRLADAGRKPSLAAAAEAVMRSQPDLAAATVNVVSGRLGLTPRTLQRELKAEGYGIRALRETIRADLALKYVRQSRLSFTEIAEILGYSQLSAFDRSFRRWYSTSATCARRHSAQTTARMAVISSMEADYMASRQVVLHTQPDYGDLRKYE